MTAPKRFIKNLYSKVPVDRTIMEIEKMLAQNGADQILKEFNEHGETMALTFKVQLGDKPILFRLPIERSALINCLSKAVQKKQIPRSILHDENRAMRIGWRIIRDWVDIQMTLVKLEMAQVEQVFLPYAVSRDGKTLYEIIKGHNFDLPQLDYEKNREE